MPGQPQFVPPSAWAGGKSCVDPSFRVMVVMAQA
jgi:hypothetical protein